MGSTYKVFFNTVYLNEPRHKSDEDLDWSFKPMPKVTFHDHAASRQLSSPVIMYIIRSIPGQKYKIHKR